MAGIEMRKINSGKLTSAGYDAGSRALRVQLSDGSTLEYVGVGERVWQSLCASASPWSYYRDNIEEEFAARRISAVPPAGRNPLDELFGKTCPDP